MMLRRLHTGAALLALLLGLVHCGLALRAPEFTVSLLWFIGTGVAILCVALSNLLAGRGASLSPSVGLLLQNALMATFFCAAWIVLPQPQVIAGGALFGTMALLSTTSLFMNGKWRTAIP